MSINKKDASERLSDIGDTLDDWWTGRPRVFRVLVWCAGLAVVAVVGLSFFIYQAFRTKDWNTQAYIVKGVRATASAPGIVFIVDLENTTPDDLTLSSSVRFMTASRENGALRDSDIKFVKDHYFIPKNHTVEVMMWTPWTPDGCKEGEDSRACYSANFGSEREIVLFDDSQRIETHIPVPATVPAETIHAPDAPATP